MKALHLLPTPRRLTVTGEPVVWKKLPLEEHLGDVAEPGPEAYRLELTATNVRLIARTATGLRNARATLAQLPQLCPCLVIDDAPRFAQRGVMLDISRDRVPTMTTLFGLVDHLAAWKMNHLQLYVEHTIAYVGHDDVWRSASPLSLEELSALDAYCRRQGVALNANQNCLGHFERWLRHPRYAPLGEVTVPHMLADGGWYVEPNTLCPTDPRTLPLIADLLQQQLPRCSGPYANIGCDEPWDLGMGRSRDACTARGRGTVFSEYVTRVCTLARDLGKRPQFWCDPQPNESGGLPADLIALVWGYGADTDFATRAASHRAVGRSVWVAPGTNCWNSATGRTWMRRANLDLAATETEAEGFLCTAWGDGGHRQQWPITLMGFADAAQAAWSGPGAYDDVAAGRHAFGTDALGLWLARLGDLDGAISRGERPDWNRTRGNKHKVCTHWDELATNIFEPVGWGDREAWEEVATHLDALGDPPLNADALFIRECKHAAAVMRWIVDRALLRRTGLTVPGRKELAARMCELVAEHRELWMERCRPGGLNDSCLHYSRYASNW